MEEQVENTNPESVSNGFQEDKVMVEEIGDILEETGKEIQVQTEQTSENKMEDSVEKISEGAAGNEGNEMAKNGEKVPEAVEVIPEGTEAKTSGIQDEVFDAVEEITTTEVAPDKMEKAQEEIVPKQEVASATNKEEYRAPAGDLEGNVPNKDEMKELDKTTASDSSVENNVAEEETALVVNTEQVCDVVKTEGQDGEVEAGAPSGGEAQVTAAEQQREEKTEGEKEKKIEREGEEETGKDREQETGRQREEGEEGRPEGEIMKKAKEEEGSDDEGSTTSDVLEENSQSPLSSENENDQSEERTGAAQEPRSVRGRVAAGHV